jgi:hypothetical protein
MDDEFYNTGSDFVNIVVFPKEIIYKVSKYTTLGYLKKMINEEYNFEYDKMEI